MKKYKFQLIKLYAVRSNMPKIYDAPYGIFVEIDGNKIISDIPLKNGDIVKIDKDIHKLNNVTSQKKNLLINQWKWIGKW